MCPRSLLLHCPEPARGSLRGSTKQVSGLMEVALLSTQQA